PGLDERMFEDQIGIDPQLAEDRLVLRGDAQDRLGCSEHGLWDYLVMNLLMPGLKMTLPSTTTSSSSRNNCTALESTCPSSSSPLRFTSSTASAPTLMWKTSCRITGPSSSCSVTKWAVHPCTRTPLSYACL